MDPNTILSALKPATPHHLNYRNSCPPHLFYWTPTQPINEIASYLNMVWTNRNLSNQEVLQSLQIIFNNTLDKTGKQINMIHLNNDPIPTRKDF